jgi:hypothetical protein
LTSENNTFLNCSPVAQEINARIDKWDYIIFKNIYKAKEKITIIRR